MYVSYSGNLHGSNRLLHTKSKRSELANLHSQSNHDFIRPKKLNSSAYTDAIRFPVRRSNSFDVLATSTKSKKLRPKSMCSNSYYPDDL